MRSKKLVIGYAVAIFLLIFIITFNSVCSITQFDVRFETGSAAAARSAETVQERLNAYLNKSYLFFKESNVYDIVDGVCAEDGSHLKVTSVQKRFPNKITVRIEEEYERYAFYSQADNKYYITDADGKILAVADSASGTVQGEGLGNVPITGFTYTASEAGSMLTAQQSSQFALMMKLLAKADEMLGGIRGRFSSIEYGSLAERFEYFCFTFTEGLKVWLLDIDSAESHTEECFAAALEKYAGLSDALKTYGYLNPVYVTDAESGTGAVGRIDHCTGEFVLQ